jgi:hypothetical protein
MRIPIGQCLLCVPDSFAANIRQEKGGWVSGQGEAGAWVRGVRYQGGVCRLWGCACLNGGSRIACSVDGVSCAHDVLSTPVLCLLLSRIV